MLRWVLTVVFACAGMLMASGIAQAHNCSSPADCEQTAGYNTVIAIAGGVMAVGAGLLGGAIGQAASGSSTPQRPPPEPPPPAPYPGRYPTPVPGENNLPQQSAQEPPQQPPQRPPLIDPDSGEPLVVQDGSYQGGNPGDVWYGDEWVSPEEAARRVAERERELERMQAEAERRAEEGARMVHEDTAKKGEEGQEQARRERAERERLDDLRRRGRGLIDRLDDDPERQGFYEDFISRHADDPEELERALDAIRQQTFEAEQQRQLAERDRALGEEQAYGESQEYAEGVRDWSRRANRVAARFVPGGDRVVALQDQLYEGIEHYDKGGLREVARRQAAAMADNYTGGLGTAIIETYDEGGGLDDLGNRWAEAQKPDTDKFDPRVYAERVRNAEGLGDLVDVALDAREAGDEVQDFGDQLRERFADDEGAGVAGDQDAVPARDDDASARAPDDDPRRPRPDDDDPRRPRPDDDDPRRPRPDDDDDPRRPRPDDDDPRRPRPDDDDPRRRRLDDDDPRRPRPDDDDRARDPQLDDHGAPDHVRREAAQAHARARLAEQERNRAEFELDERRHHERRAREAMEREPDSDLERARYERARARREAAEQDFADSNRRADSAQEDFERARQRWHHNDPRRSQRITEEEYGRADSDLEDAMTERNRAARELEEAKQRGARKSEIEAAQQRLDERQNDVARAHTAEQQAAERARLARDRVAAQEQREAAFQQGVQNDIEQYLGGKPKNPAAPGRLQVTRDATELHSDYLRNQQRIAGARAADGGPRHPVHEKVVGHDPQTGEPIRAAVAARRADEQGNLLGEPLGQPKREEVVYQAQPDFVSSMENVGGYNQGNRTVSRPNPGTATHELMHANTSPEFRREHGGNRHVNEGMTEHFTRVIRDKRGESPSDPNWNRDRHYDPQAAKMAEVEQRVGRSTMADAYFRGETDKFHEELGKSLAKDGEGDLSLSDKERGKKYLDDWNEDMG